MAAEGMSKYAPVLIALRFNGAAAGWPRKARFAVRFQEITQPLQWGRGRMAAEGALSDGRRRTLEQLQWGRGRMAAEGWTGPLAARPKVCFNGAAAGWPRKASARSRPP